jgi:hypothetical protein
VDLLDFNRRDLVKCVQPISTLFFFFEPVVYQFSIYITKHQKGGRESLTSHTARELDGPESY